jgi:CheY-like chemotaxis protein
VVIHSEVGVGTTVELWLRASEAPRAAATPALSEAPIYASASARTALLVDDEELVRLSTADMLADLGFVVTEAASAEEALDILEGGSEFDLLVTDHLMPGMTGSELVGVLRTKMPSVPALVISGYAEVTGIAPDLPRLTKPFRRADLAQALSNMAL